MNTKSQLIIDQFIAKPIAFCLNFLVRLLGKILSIDHSLDVEFSRIVVCKFKGLGSIIQTTPMIQTLKETYPNAEITFLSTKSNATFLSKIDCIDKVITIDDSSSFRLLKTLTKAMFKMLRNRPEVYIDLEIYSNFSTLVTISTLAKNRIGFYLRSSTYKKGIYTHMMYYNTNVPISEVYMQIARLMNSEAKSPGLYPIYKNIKRNEAFNFENYIIINPNASDLRIERRWGETKYKALAKWFCETYPSKKVIFIGSPSEADYVTNLLEGLDFPNLINLAGKSTVDELIQLIHSAELVITNDSGPMHIAFACDTQTIALFGPCSPNHYGWTANVKIIYKSTYCSPCVHEFITPPCKGNNVCMQLIEVEEVKKEVVEFYENDMSFSNQKDLISDINYKRGDLVLGLVNRSK
jgi:ADP-heptose:LPS heptosyltransferase